MADALPLPALRRFLDADARRLGFDAVGVATPAEDALAGERLDAFLAAGHHGTMAWLPETAERRRAVTALWDEARSVVVLGLNYGPDEDPLAVNARTDRGAISVYARHRDYHDVVKGKLKELAGRMVARAGARPDGRPHDAKVFVDTAPLMEKPLGQAAGLGWQGKHTNLVSREFGSWLFLGSIATTIAFEPDAPGVDSCGSCRSCQDACPTGAFPQPYRIDARRCISYLTIETRAPVPRALRPLMGNRIYGCDDCLAVCPWNKFARTAREAKLQAREDLRAPRLEALLRLDDAAFRTLFSGSPVKRIGRDKFVSNCLIAAGNAGRPDLLPDVRRRLGDAAPVVRAMAVWALGRLAPEEALAARGEALAHEMNDEVRMEWDAIEGGRTNESC
ncbi:tRNA epoxyqueuosine(34) reductase QueG [Aureimonas phyllosphaerae]|uniref:Epoxyqueuosine reductase n=1 Tax=Aureimonas phyllosphaerae TaxID=1166078 RepID=A0A7W6BRJ6_9HYPH|nr:tRNA epoxyqueuosine(34) reductase QueG [Aureimonas phyllosphaerae]MBB3936769.1 epoxyqueuosine reductase [Aureimonas phyllosphaerae]MBB3960368.1 epoxyqueuosine reductase [Aureimonas phyllosphaerae]SFF22113.1 epoxyqueuosine reductase [Aureimonas phyllosphaerae]